MKKTLLIFFIFLCPLTVAAELPPAMQGEITHLLEFIFTSPCKFNRNGTWYTAVQAQEHIKRKYEYLMKRDRIESTADFISGAASKSSFSGKKYHVQCGDNPVIESADWLESELAQYRKNQRSSP